MIEKRWVLNMNRININEASIRDVPQWDVPQWKTHFTVLGNESLKNSDKFLLVSCYQRVKLINTNQILVFFRNKKKFWLPHDQSIFLSKFCTESY